MKSILLDCALNSVAYAWIRKNHPKLKHIKLTIDKKTELTAQLKPYLKDCIITPGLVGAQTDAGYVMSSLQPRLEVGDFDFVFLKLPSLATTFFDKAVDNGLMPESPMELACDQKELERAGKANRTVTLSESELVGIMGR